MSVRNLARAHLSDAFMDACEAAYVDGPSTSNPVALKSVTVLRHAQIVHVRQDGKGDYTTIGGALAAITDASATKVYVLVIYPGTYAENVTWKSWVLATSWEGPESVTISPATGNALLLSDPADVPIIEGLTFKTSDPDVGNVFALKCQVTAAAPSSEVFAMFRNCNILAGHTNAAGFHLTRTAAGFLFRVDWQSSLAFKTNGASNPALGVRVDNGGQLYVGGMRLDAAKGMEVLGNGQLLIYGELDIFATAGNGLHINGSTAIVQCTGRADIEREGNTSGAALYAQAAGEWSGAGWYVANRTTGAATIEALNGTANVRARISDSEFLGGAGSAATAANITLGDYTFANCIFGRKDSLAGAVARALFTPSAGGTLTAEGTVRCVADTMGVQTSHGIYRGPGSLVVRPSGAAGPMKAMLADGGSADIDVGALDLQSKADIALHQSAANKVQAGRLKVDRTGAAGSPLTMVAGASCKVATMVPISGAGNTGIDVAPTATLEIGAYGGQQVTAFTDRTGGPAAATDVVVLDNANDDSVIQAGGAGDTKVAGVVVYAASGVTKKCLVARGGPVAAVKVQGAVVRGDLLETSATLPRGQANNAAANGAVFGKARTAFAGPGAGTVDVLVTLA